MTPRTPPRTPIRPSSPHHTLAARAAVLLLVLAGVAALLGCGFVYASTHLDQLARDDAFRERLELLRRELPFDPRALFVGYGAMLLTYAAVAAAIGLLVRGGGRTTTLVAAVMATLVATLTGLVTAFAVLAGGPANAVVPAFVCALHGLAAWWLFGALRASPGGVAVGPITPRVPMQDYYLPPVQPASRTH